MANSKLNNTELIRYKAISGRMSDYFFEFKLCDDGLTVQFILLKTFSIWFTTNHSHIMDRTPCGN